MATLKELGREWAGIAIRHGVEPCTTGNLEHDRECAQAYMWHTGHPPSWWDRERHGPIYRPSGHYPREYTR